MHCYALPRIAPLRCQLSMSSNVRSVRAIRQTREGSAMRNRTVTALTHRLLLVVIGAMLAIPAIAQLPTYQMRDLGTLTGSSSSASDINEKGQVTGIFRWSNGFDGSTSRPFLYDFSSKTMANLGWPYYRPLDNLARVSSINDAGQVAASGPLSLRPASCSSVRPCRRQLDDFWRLLCIGNRMHHGHQ